MARIVEAYVLHDKLILSHEGDDDVILDFLEPDENDDVECLWRVDGESGKVSDLLHPFVSPILQADLDDLGSAFRYLRSGLSKHKMPSRTRTVPDWLSLPDAIEQGLVLGELGLSQKLEASYYPASSASEFVGEQVLQFGESAVALLRQFTNARDSQINMVVNLIRPLTVEVSPPLVLAFALNSAATLGGLRNVVRDLRNDSRIHKLRTFVSEISSTGPEQQIHLCQIIDAEMRHILGSDQDTINMAAAISTIPKFYANFWQELASAAPRANRIDEFIDKLRVRSRLNILRSLHSTVPDIKNFYQDLKRVFGELSFDENHLRSYLANRKTQKTGSAERKRSELKIEGSLSGLTRKSRNFRTVNGKNNELSAVRVLRPRSKSFLFFSPTAPMRRRTT